MRLRSFFLVLSVIACLFIRAQETAILNGTIRDLTEHPLKGITVMVQEEPGLGTSTDYQGKYTLKVPAGRKINIVFRSINVETLIKPVRLKAGETYDLSAKLTERVINIDSIDIKGNKQRNNAGMIEFKPVESIVNASGSVESQLRYTGLGVRTIGGEISSAYSVRGGSFDENLVYVNDFEVFRPYLVRSGQQEGLTFANQDLISNIKFYSGGFPTKYGDKMSSVMDVTYKKPRRFGMSASGSLLGSSFHIEGTSKDTNTFSYLIGFRQKSAQYLIKSLQTKGQYSPLFYDIQGFFTFKPHPKHSFELLTSYASNRFLFNPVDRQTDFGVVNKVVRLKMYFDGAENDRYQSFMGGLAYNYMPTEKLKLRFMFAGYRTAEREAYDITGEYFLGEVETDITKSNYNEIKYGLGTGLTQNWARNELYTTILNAKHVGTWYFRQHTFNWGFSYKHEMIDDKLNEWGRLDSTGYTLPFSVNEVNIAKYLKSGFVLNSNRYEGYIQDSWWTGDKNIFRITGGIRFHYWDVNSEFLASPRLQLSLKPNLKKNVTFTFSTGLYQQAPFYREMRDLNGNINLRLKAQKSYHAVLGADLDFYAWNRPFKFTTEAYYKYMWDLVPYELDNVLIRYYGKNNAKGFAYGIDFRLNGELAKGDESWISLSFLNARENILDDYYMEYRDDSGRITYPNAYNARPAVDSIARFPGMIPRPTDQRVAFSMFFQDHIPKVPELKVHVSLDFATGLPFGAADGRKDMDTLRIPAYKRVDIGFSGNLYNSQWKNHHIKTTIFKHLKSIWLSFEVFNVFGINNTVSYLWIKDFNNQSYAVPNYLSNRRFNARLVIKF